jgi:hypothetical protein
VRGASLLLSREAAPDDDDSDDGAAKKPEKSPDKSDDKTDTKPDGQTSAKPHDAGEEKSGDTASEAPKADHPRAVTAKNARSPAARSDPD